MSQSLLFVLKEGITGLAKSRFAGVVATITIAVSLILIGVFLIITMNLNRFVENLRSRVELEIFLNDAMNEETIQALSEAIRNIEGVEEVTFISKEMAILEFKKLFKDQEEDYFETLGYNPLPASFRVRLTRGFRTTEGVEMVSQQVSTLGGIDAEDVVYRRDFLVFLEKYVKAAIVVVFLVGTIICLGALLLVSNNIRLIIMSKERLIQTMRLVGATNFFIRVPLYIQGAIQGFVGGVFSALFLYFLLKLGSFEIPGLIQVNVRVYWLILTLGIMLGLTGSITAVRRYL